MDRRFTFSDPKILQLLKEEFVPAVGNTHELQNQQFASSKWFMSMAAASNPRVLKGITSQGFYVAGPDGQAYGFNNNRGPQRVLAFLNDGLKLYAQHPPVKIDIPAEEVQAKFCQAPAQDVSIVQVYSRITPMPEGADVLNGGVGRDYLWVYPEEAKAINQGKEFPATLARRIVRFHFVDNVRGEPDFWAPGEVERADFKLIRAKSGWLSFTGQFAMKTSSGSRGLEGRVEGEILVNGSQVTRMKAYADCTSWGAGQYTPRPPAGKFPLKFAMVMASGETARVTPPQAALYGDGEYHRPK